LKITTASQEQWDRINSLKQEWIDNTTKQYSFEEVREIVCKMYIDMGLDPPVVLLAPSPLSMVLWSSVVSKISKKELCSQLSSQLSSQLDSKLRSQLDSQISSQLNSQLHSQLSPDLKNEPYYTGYWWRAWSGWYAGAEILGVKFQEEKLRLFIEFNERASIWCTYDKLCVVSKNPTQIHWYNKELHCENDMSVKYEDGWGIYSINGIGVNEQIVLRPESQSLSQINEEKSQEVKNIRIDRLLNSCRYISDGNYYNLFKVNNSYFCITKNKYYYSLHENKREAIKNLEREVLQENASKGVTKSQ
jgi:hypothetical protein